ncbi:MAG TPA: hypothetical protein VLD37_00510 [Candidatus Bilamarchaeum sp.]|nr:hypothetical protein [Candidatus Bilamarchaeum sp.]
MNVMSIVSENRGAIIFALLVMAVGSAAYAFSDNLDLGIGNDGKEVLETARFKVVSAPDGSSAIIANARNNALASLRAAEGNPVPEEDSVVLGAGAAMRMKELGQASRPGGHIIGYSGINATIEGVLAQSGSPMDDMVFLSARQFDEAGGDEGRVFSRTSVEGVPKMFFWLGMNETAPKGFEFAEGSRSGYSPHNLDGKTYYPIIIGAKEAEAMRSEKIFEDTGDTIRDFFGADFVVAGVLEETNTSIDRLHFIPLKGSELGG